MHVCGLDDNSLLPIPFYEFYRVLSNSVLRYDTMFLLCTATIIYSCKLYLKIKGITTSVGAHLCVIIMH